MSNLPYPSSEQNTGFPMPQFPPSINNIDTISSNDIPININNPSQQVGFIFPKTSGTIPDNPDKTSKLSGEVDSQEATAPLLPNSTSAYTGKISGQPSEGQYPQSGPAVQNTSLTANDVTALVNVGTSIAVNGRNPIKLICPHCKISITTKTVETKNEEADSSANRTYLIVGALLTVMICGAFGFAAAKSGHYKVALYGIPGFLVVVLGLIGCAKLCNDGLNLFADVTHYCPMCRAKLGVSNGKDEYARQQRGLRY